MDKSGQEWVSAAVDGEVDNNALADLSKTRACHNKWRNYHIIGDVMRNEMPKNFAIDLSERIANALNDEAPICVDSANHVADIPKTLPSKNNIASDDNNSLVGKAKVIPLFKQFGQYAIAASVALVAVVGVQSYNQSQDAATAPLPVLDTRPLVGSVSPVSLQTGPVQQYNQTANDNNEQLAEQRRRLNAYIQDHMLQQRLNSEAVLNNNLKNTTN